MSTLGILPMAGKGLRWGGYLKELLPVGEGVFLCDLAISNLLDCGCNKICIVTSAEKASMHFNHFSMDKYNGLDIFFVIQRGNELQGALRSTLNFNCNLNIMLMPDTAFAFKHPFAKFDKHFGLGLFETSNPERFGVYDEQQNAIRDKDRTLLNTKQRAWGCVYWDHNITKIWKESSEDKFPNLLNSWLKRFEVEKFDLEWYLDMASWRDYRNALLSDFG